MVAAPKYLDFPCSELVEHGWEIWLECACGHHSLMKASTFKRWADSSLHRLVAKSRCSKCGALGDVPEVRLSVIAAGGFAGGDHKCVPALPVRRPPCCPVGEMSGHG